MQKSTERFLTTHTGSLPRPDDLIRMMYAKEEGVPVEPAALAARIKAAVAEVVKKQADAGAWKSACSAIPAARAARPRAAMRPSACATRRRRSPTPKT
jgi:hypothetical protein